MQDGQEFTINGTVYTLYQFDDVRMNGATRMTGWFWSCKADESGLFDTALEALQDAINTESATFARRADEYEAWQGALAEDRHNRDLQEFYDHR